MVADTIFVEEKKKVNSSEQLGLESCRKNIDAIDAKIMKLLQQRLNIVAQVGVIKEQSYSKQNQGKCFIRPAREADMVRDLLIHNNNVYPPQAIAALWRVIISSSVNYEKRLSILAYGTKTQKDSYWLAREYFSTFVDISMTDSVATVIANVAEKKCSIGVLPWPNSNKRQSLNWWQELARVSEQGVYIFARLPFIYNPEKVNQELSAVAIAWMDPELGRDNVTLWYVESSDTNSSNASAMMVMLEQLVPHAKVLDYSNSTYLLQLPGFHIDPIGNPLFNHIMQHAQGKISRIVPLGSYAAPIIIT